MNTKILSNEIIFKPRYSEIDSMKVMHHSKYWLWFEECRFHFVKEVLGISVEDLKDLKCYMPVVNCQCQYKKPIFWDGESIVETRLKHTKKAFFIFKYNVRANNAKKELLTTATTEHVLIGLDFKLKVEIPNLFTKKINQMMIEKPHMFIN